MISSKKRNASFFFRNRDDNNRERASELRQKSNWFIICIFQQSNDLFSWKWCKYTKWALLSRMRINQGNWSNHHVPITKITFSLASLVAPAKYYATTLLLAPIYKKSMTPSVNSLHLMQLQSEILNFQSKLSRKRSWIQSSTMSLLTRFSMFYFRLQNNHSQ